MLVFIERGIHGLTLRAWDMVLTDINTLRTCKDITGLTVTSVGAGRNKTAEALITDFHTLFVELKC